MSHQPQWKYVEDMRRKGANEVIKVYDDYYGNYSCNVMFKKAPATPASPSYTPKPFSLGSKK